MSLLLIDFEATGVDPKTARIIEVGAMLVDNEFNPAFIYKDAAPELQHIGSCMSTLVYETGHPALTPEVVEVTGITQDELTAKGVPLEVALKELLNLTRGQSIDYLIAYNRKYDEVLFNQEVKRIHMDILPEMHWLMQVPWLCAMEDIETNYKYKSWRMMHMALEYGVTVNPTLLHRAINDVELMRQLLKASDTTPGDMFKFQSLPWVYVAADVRPPWTDDGKSSTEAKKLGFKWESAGDDRKFPKTWVKRIKPHQFVELQHKTNLNLKEIA